MTNIDYDIRDIKDKVDKIERRIINIEDMLEQLIRKLQYGS